MKPAPFALVFLLVQVLTLTSSALPYQGAGASVEGLVVRAGTSEPMRGASVRLGGTNAISNSAPAATTNDSGKFKFSDVAPGAYHISVAHEGYLRAEHGERGPGRSGTRVTVRAGQEVKDIVIGLTPTGAISGRVYRRDREPLKNAMVQLLKYQYVDGRRMLMIWQQARTSDGGEYRFNGLHPGPYVISALPAERRAAANGPRAPVQIEPGEAYLPVYFPGTTDVDAAAPIDLLPGVDYNGVDLNVMEQDALRLRGQVIDGVTGLPPSAFFITLSPRERRTRIAGSTAPRHVPVAADGTFTVGAVPPGLYDLVATLGDGSGRLSARVQVSVGADVENVRLVLQPGFHVSGRVTITDLPPDEQDANMRNVRVQLLHEPYIAQVAPPAATVRPDGRFVFLGVMPGDYRVQVTTGFGSYVSYARLGGADILNSVVNITGSDELDIRLNPKVATLDATVFDDKNAPEEAIQVVLVPDYPNRRRLDLYRTGLTNGSGHVHLKEIEPGDYKLFAWEFLESGAWQDPDFIQRHEDLGRRVHLGQSAGENVNLTVIPARR